MERASNYLPSLAMTVTDSNNNGGNGENSLPSQSDAESSGTSAENSGGSSESSLPDDTSQPETPDNIHTPSDDNTPDPSGGGSGGGSENSGSDSHTHVFGTYRSDNNATCTSDGTKTAMCEVCGDRNTVTDTGSKLPHTEVERIT